MRLAAVGVLWAASVVAGFASLARYSATAGPTVRAATPGWPDASRVERAKDKATLVLFAHPKCPCTRATMNELAWLMTHLAGSLEARVLFVAPPGVDAAWADTDIVRRAKAIDGVTVSVDALGAEARRFGACTSGVTYLYTSTGQRLFSGGITGARGHEGDNAGRRAVVECVKNRTIQAETPAYGCGLFGPE